jgi:hypothetical protein
MRNAECGVGNGERRGKNPNIEIRNSKQGSNDRKERKLPKRDPVSNLLLGTLGNCFELRASSFGFSSFPSCTWERNCLGNSVSLRIPRSALKLGQLPSPSSLPLRDFTLITRTAPCSRQLP